jgi:hypothetical protein
MQYNNIFNEWCWNNQISVCKKLILSYISRYSQKLKLDTDLNIKAKTIKLLEENIKEYLHKLKVAKIS